MQMRQFPAFFNMDDALIAVFGGGEEARRKVRLLAATGAKITVLADRLSDAFAEEFEGRITHLPLSETRAALSAARFTIIALEDDALAEETIALAKSMRVPVNAVDRPEACDFTVPSILDRGDVVAAIGTGGAAPVLAKQIRTQLETLMPQGIEPLAALAKQMRADVKAALTDGKARRRFWEAAFSGPALDLATANDMPAAKAELQRLLRAHAAKQTGQEFPVHIVGAGPGDPELLTLKAFRLIQQADVVFHDRLVSAEIMDLVRRDADRISVGKTKGHHSVPQPQIHDLMIEAARAGQRVVRLKGGDPFVFGRGGEELQALQAAGLTGHIVPGISAALGCAASAGLPLTHRDHAQSLTFVTGHAKSGEVPDLDWPALAAPHQTVVVFMGVGTASIISEKLIAAGRGAATPVAVIENGTRSNEIRVFGALSGLPQLISDAGIKGPALLIIGDVAGLPVEALAKLSKEAAA
jgi:uroporphyrin-III C-methyltransferase/precorrin-2 dehydrogenase/sirohydrochlorin ferrochelatase